MHVCTVCGCRCLEKDSICSSHNAIALRSCLWKAERPCPLGQVLLLSQIQQLNKCVLALYGALIALSKEPVMVLYMPATLNITVVSFKDQEQPWTRVVHLSSKHGNTTEWTEQRVSAWRRKKMCFCEVVSCSLAASAWPRCTQVSVSRSEHCKMLFAR